MPIIATNSGTTYEPLAAGSYAARCYSMIHIGTSEENIMGKTKSLNKVRISWELPTETKVFKEENGEQPYVVSKEFNLSMNEKSNLRKFLTSWRGKSFTEEEAEAFDITKLIGAKCMLSISHKAAKNGNTYAEISGVSLLPKGMSCPPQINDTQVLSYDDWNEDLFNSLPEFLRNKIVQTDEYKKMVSPNERESVKTDDSDDVGF